jgi:hypothetical protein
MPLDADYHVDHSPEAEEYSGWSIIEVEKGNALPQDTDENSPSI